MLVNDILMVAMYLVVQHRKALYTVRHFGTRELVLFSLKHTSDVIPHACNATRSARITACMRMSIDWVNACIRPRDQMREITIFYLWYLTSIRA